jgi:hypothetical protein
LSASFIACPLGIACQGILLDQLLVLHDHQVQIADAGLLRDHQLLEFGMGAVARKQQGG